jgi:hypothetical protein
VTPRKQAGEAKLDLMVLADDDPIELGEQGLHEILRVRRARARGA